jgi:uncharacterized protein YigA (DUF484 family)
MTKANKKVDEPQIAEAEVVDFLEKHPEFFEGHEDLLLEMVLPHKKGEAVSLVERQVSLLRKKNKETGTKLDEFVVAAGINNKIFDNCRKLVLNLIDAEDPDQFFRALENSFKKDFKCTAYSLIIFSERATQINHFTSSVSEMAAKEYIGGLIRAKKPTLGVLRPAEQDFLFRHQSVKVKSAAVLSVRKNRQIALLAIGSGDANYFQPGMGTVFLGFIADTLAKLIPKHIYLKHQ